MKCRYTTASIHWSGFIPVKKAWNCWTVSRRNTLPAYKPHDAQTGEEGMRADIRPETGYPAGAFGLRRVLLF